MLTKAKAANKLGNDKGNLIRGYKHGSNEQENCFDEKRKQGEENLSELILKEERHEDAYNAVHESTSKGVNERTSEVTIKGGWCEL